MANMNMEYLCGNWGLETGKSRELYHEVVEPLREEKGITDAHNHLSARQIVENENFPDIFTAMILDTNAKWPNRDHYITQQSAKKGVPYSYLINSGVSNYNKWKAISEIFPKLAGNQVYTWAHLELKNVLGISQLLSGKTADSIWQKANEILSSDAMKPQAILESMKTKVLGTTDDPLDDLEYHKQARDEIQGIKIFPTFRPDRSMNIFAPGWKSYIASLCEKTGKSPSLNGLLEALRQRHNHFAEYGCKASDHGLKHPYGLDTAYSRAEEIFKKVFEKNEDPSPEEIRDFISFMMHRFCGMNKEKGWVTQIHFGAVRDINPYLFSIGGPDCGGDMSTNMIEIVENLTPLLGKYCTGADGEKDLKVVLYCIDPAHYPTIATLCRTFPSVRWGVPWWFNDTTFGMEDHLNYMMQSESYSNCAGMVCDGRKILSIAPRHEVFARSVCSVIGGLMEKGMLPEELLPEIVEDLCYNNQVKLFGF